MSGPLKTRWIEEIGTRCWLRIYWQGTCSRGTYHNAMRFLKDGSKGDNDFGGRVDDYLDSGLWPNACEDCGTPVPDPADERLDRQVFYRRLFNTQSGRPEPGDLYWMKDWAMDREAPHCLYGWSNCTGKHLYCVLPTGREWDIDSRCSNCTLPEDKEHRCWVKHIDSNGVVQVDKNGHTCAAGAGSIAVPDWHGFLHHGVLHT